MVFADKRYARKDKISKLPQWIQDEIEKKNTAISTDIAVQMAKSFFKDMGQPFDFPEGLLYDKKKLDDLNQKSKEPEVKEAKQESESDDNVIVIDFNLIED